MSTATITGMNVSDMLRLGKTVTIASIFPIEQSIGRKFRTKQPGGHWTTYKLAACADPNKPETITIGDAMENVFLGTNSQNRKMEFQEIPVPGGAPQIADDFITNTRKAAANAEDQKACPGIWICEGDAPTAQEIETAKRWQYNYFVKLQIEADDKWFAGQKEFVGSLHRIAAAYLKLDARKHEWMREAQMTETRECPFCQTTINASAIKCSTCNEVVDVARYAEHKKAMAEASALLEAEGVALPAAAVAPVKPVPNQPIHPPTQRK